MKLSNYKEVTMFIKIAVIFFMSWSFIFNNTYAQSIKEQYELQERCKKSVDMWFQKQYAGQTMLNDEDYQTFIYYTNHYNKKLNKCFVLVVEDSTLKEWIKDKKNTKNKLRIIIYARLFDINENKIYGEYTMLSKEGFHNIISYVLDQNNNKIPCKDRNHFQALIKQYMEE